MYILFPSHRVAEIMSYHSMHFYDKQYQYVIQEHLAVVC